MRIQEIITENIFTTDHHKVMDAVAQLYLEHYGVDIWSNSQAHDHVAKCLMKRLPTVEELDLIIDTGDLPQRFHDIDFPTDDEVMFGIRHQQVHEEPASRKLCTSSKPNSALGASNLASCKSQGYRSREGGKSHKIGDQREKVRGKRIKGKKYGGPLPDWS